MNLNPVGAALLGLLAASFAVAGDGGPRFLPFEPVDRVHGLDQALLERVVQPQPTLLPLPGKSDLDRLWRAGRPRGDGGGGDVMDLVVFQRTYSHPEFGNVVILIWNENTANPAGVQVFFNDIPQTIVEGLPAADLPGANSISFRGAPAGRHTFRVEAEGTSSEFVQLVVDVQPFTDVTDLRCAESEPRDPVAGTCPLEATWTSGPDSPGSLIIRVNQAGQQILSGEIATDRGMASTVGLAPGTYCVTSQALHQNADGNYLGEVSAESCCEVVCTDDPCDPPGNLLLCQIAYGAGDDNSIYAQWDNGEALYASGVTGLIDGSAVGTLPGDAQQAIFQNLPTGDRRIGIQGGCGADGLSVVVEDTIKLLPASPHTNPVSGPITCAFNPETEETTATWTNADPSAFIRLLVDDPEIEPMQLGFLAGDATEVTLGNSTSATTILLQFFKIVDGDCYGSELIGCSSPGKKYTQGVCNGVGNTPQITSAIFGLNFLFAGGPQPPCRKACDVDGNGSVDLTDMVRILNYLFAGGIPPSLWRDSDGDQKPDPTCTTAAPEDSCETEHEACAG